MRDALEFGIKSFFAGCLGFLGVITMVAFAAGLFGLVFQSKIQSLQTEITGKFQSVPDLLSQGFPGEGDEDPGTGEESRMEEGSEGAGEQPGLFIYITEGEHPDNEKLSSLTKGQAANVSVWVKSLAESPVSFILEITMPDGTKHPFGQGYTTDPSMDAVFCGALNLVDPPSGNYILQAFREGISIAANTFDFNITE
jgi:hypothetical protein